MTMTAIKANELASATKTNELESEIKSDIIPLSSKAILKESLSEEEAIEEELEGKYKKLTDLFKRKFKPALWEELESEINRKNCFQSSRGNKSFTCAESRGNKYTLEKLTRIGAYTSIVGLAGIYATEAFAVGFKFNEAATAAFTPIIDGIGANWGKAVAITGIGGMFLSEGDGRTRAIKAGIGAGCMGALILAVTALFA